MKHPKLFFGNMVIAISMCVPLLALAGCGSMAAAGYLTGDENGSFNPTDTATRAQTAVVLYRIIK